MCGKKLYEKLSGWGDSFLGGGNILDCIILAVGNIYEISAFSNYLLLPPPT
jgi:hypothetical protein